MGVFNVRQRFKKQPPRGRPRRRVDGGEPYIVFRFRRDPRIVEKVLQRYIPALTVMGGAFVGFLAGYADLTGAIGTGTGILLTVMIIKQMYDQLYSEHADEIPAPIRKVMGD